MAFTYSDPSNSNLEEVRFLIGDTDSTDQQFQDAEITYLLTSEGSVTAAAVAAVRALIAKYARKVNKSVGDLRLSYSDRTAHYKDLLKTLQARQGLKTAAPIAGGISKARKETVEQDTDRVVPFAERDQFDHPGTPDFPESKFTDPV